MGLGHCGTRAVTPVRATIAWHLIEVENTMKKLPNIDTQLLVKFALMLAGLSFLFMQVDGLKELGSVLLALCLLPFIFKLPEDK